MWQKVEFYLLNKINGTTDFILNMESKNQETSLR